MQKPSLEKYVVGFLFTPDLSHVLMIRKNRPTWQAGKLNGLGGLIKPEDRGHAHTAMVREFREESGLDTRSEHWRIFARMYWNGGELDCLVAIGEAGAARDMTDEPCELRPVSEFHPAAAGIVENCAWLVPMARDFLTIAAKALAAGDPNPAPFRVEVRYS